MTSFNDLGVSNSLIRELRKDDINSPTKVQVKSIPLIFNDSDLLVQSETGSGKTISFAVPLIDAIKPSGVVKALVITPTRELARQVAGEFKKFSDAKGLGVAIVYGGASIKRQHSEIKEADIVVGTPGRLLDMIGRGMLNLGAVEYLVLDEADRMLDMGFVDDVSRIISYTPSDRQGLMFSATMSGRVLKLMNKFLDDPKKIMLDNKLDSKLLNQVYYNVDSSDKLSFLVHYLKNSGDGLKLVFCNTKHWTRKVAGFLKKHGLKADCLNGDMSQHLREKVLKRFTNNKFKVLVATDVAARGLDVDDITHVINYDLPSDPKRYTHRIGRTARNGREGTAVIILSEPDYSSMDRVMQEHRDTIERLDPGDFKHLDFKKRRGRSKKLFKAVCDKCGGRARLPFKPDGSRPVFCSDCFSKIKKR